MGTNFQIDVKKSNGHLHVIPRGNFDGSSAWELVNLLHEQYDGNGDVVIDTQHLEEISPFGCSTFQCRLNRNTVPAERLVFQGDKAGKISPEGSKVVSSHGDHKCQCDGNCPHCPCASEKKTS